MSLDFAIEVGPNMLDFLILLGFAAIIYAALRGLSFIIASTGEEP